MSVDQDTIARILMRDRSRILAYIWSIVHDQNLAEDIIQEVCVVALNRRREIKDESHLHSWIRTTARNISLNILQSKRRHVVTLDEQTMNLLEGAWHEYDDPELQEMTEALRQCLKKLSPYASKLITLRYSKNLTGKRLAAEMGRSVPAVYKAVTRIHSALGQCIRKVLASNDELNPGGGHG